MFPLTAEPLDGPTITDVTVTETGTGWLVRTPAYALELSAARPRALLRGADGQVWTDLSLLASAHRLDVPHESVAPLDGPLGARRVGARQDGARRVDDATFEVPTASAAWEESALEVRCTPERVVLRLRVRGTGRLGDVTLGGGRAVLPSGAAGEFRSGVAFRSVFVPTPTEPVHVVRPAATPAQLGVVGDAEPGRLHGIFSPPPLTFAFGRGPATSGTEVPEGGQWLAAAVVAPVEECGFTTIRYEPVDGGWLVRLAYEGHTAVDGEWVSPGLALTPVASAWESIDAYRELVAPTRAHRSAPAQPAAWWLQPIFCGWGAQCATAAAISRAQGVDEKAEAEAAAGLVVTAGAASAPALARQDLYDRWLARLAEHGVVPGTVVIDDRWQAAYGTCEPDPERWPDLRGWIAGRHAAGQRVLLWFKAWDPQGLPAEECVLDAAGRPVAADVSNPAYLARLREIVTWMVSPQGLDADGFKVDFTQRAPSGATLRTHAGTHGNAPGGVQEDTGQTWGIAGLHRLMSTVHGAAKAAKADALVVNHTVNPLFADVTDMVRLNDVLERDGDGERAPVAGQVRFRAAVAAAALPGTPIDTDQWPMPDRSEWLSYSRVQPELGVPALYYAESIDNTGEPITAADLAEIAESWAKYRAEAGIPVPDPAAPGTGDE